MREIKKPKIKSTEFMKKILADYYADLGKAEKSDPKELIAWCTSAGPCELLRSFGFKVYFPENHTAILGTSRIANDVIPLANSVGFSPDICSYLTSDIGAYISGVTPLSKMYGLENVPKPDVLVYNTNQCHDVQDWFSYYAERLNIPAIGINPPTRLPEVTNSQLEYVVSQFKDLSIKLEKIADKKFDLNELKKVLTISRENGVLWNSILKSAKNHPSPLDFFDACIHMGPIVVLRGEQIVTDYYQVLKEEFDERLKNGVGVVENEEARLYWDGMPIWGKLRSLSDHFFELNSCVVASTYCNSWSFSEVNPSDPFNSMAKSYTEVYINRDENYRLQYLKRMAEEFEFDGIIFHDSKTCPNTSSNRYRLPQRFQEQSNIPFITINGDQNDLRCFSEEQTKTNVEAFIEQIKSSKELLA